MYARWFQLLAISLFVTGSSGVAVAAKPAPSFYQAYYLEHAQQDYAAAAELYGRVLNDGVAADTVLRQAREGLARCREELATVDLAGLMPAETFAYVELNNPGAQVSQLLDHLGLLGGDQATAVADQRVAISPKLVNALLGLRGAAVAITGFDPQKHKPTGVVVLHPGNLEVLRGAIETALPVAGSAETVGGYPLYYIHDGEFYVCLSSRLVIASPQKEQITAVLDRLAGRGGPSFANNEAMAEVLAGRQKPLLFLCADAKKAMPLISGLAGDCSELAQARAILDLDSWRSVSAKFGVHDDRVGMDLAIALDRGHHNLIYNLVRTPPVTRETFRGIPHGVVGFLVGAMNERDSRFPPVTGKRGPSSAAVTGLDVGREIFANVVDFSVFALPPAGEPGSGPALPEIAAVIRVHDPAKSELLWTQLLGIASMAAGAPTTDGTVQSIGDVQAKAYRFQDGVTVYVGARRDTLIASTTPAAMQAAVQAADGGSSILEDDDFAAALKQVGDDTSKALFLSPGRILRLAAPHMDNRDRQEIAPFVPLLRSTVVSLMTHESEEKLQLSAGVSGLPDVAPIIAQFIRQEQDEERFRQELRTVRQQHNWDRALELVDARLREGGMDTDLYRTRFDILALGKQDSQAARRCADDLLNRLDDATALNGFSWALLTDKRYQGAYSDVALRFAEKACANTNHGQWALLDTLALAKFEAEHDVDAAIGLQEKAIRLHGGDHQGLQQALQRYQSAREQQH